MSARVRWQHLWASSLSLFFAAVGCNQIEGIDGIKSVDGCCKPDVDGHDQNPCTAAACGQGSKCAHAPVPDGLMGDGINGNCMVLQCMGGEETKVASRDDFDDGDDCTADSCTADGAQHAVQTG